MRWLALLALLAGCSEGTSEGEDPPATPVGGLPASSWEGPGEVPGAPPPDEPLEAPVSGPARLVVSPGSLVAPEGRETTLQIGLAGEGGPLDLEIDVVDSENAGLEIRPATLRLAAGEVAKVAVRPAFDADEVPGRATLRLRPKEGSASAIEPWEVPLVVHDPHRTLTLALDADQLAFVATSQDKSVRLDVGVSLGESPDNLVDLGRAEINLRGKGTLRCDRRSFTVRMDKKFEVSDSPETEDFLLLSMCHDQTYMSMRVALEMAASLGIFPAWFGYVELRYGGESRGVYLMVERPRDALHRAFPGAELILRRLRDAEVELERPGEDDLTPAERAERVLPYMDLYEIRSRVSGEALLGALRTAMDYDAYLRWLALNSALMNGDYIDEVYFHDGLGTPGAPRFGIMAWDYDDILHNCHTPRPIDDPRMYCAESGLDRPVRDDAFVSAAYEAELLAVLEGPASEAALQPIAGAVAGELSVYLARPGVAAIMTREDLGPPDVEAGRVGLLDGVGARRAALVDLLR